MTALDNLIGDYTYLIIDHESNRFNFCDLVEIDTQLIEDAEYGTDIYFYLNDELSEDVKRVIDTFIENDVYMENYTGILIFEENDKTYYLLTW